jgi:hypothetical protein
VEAERGTLRGQEEKKRAGTALKVPGKEGEMYTLYDYLTQVKAIEYLLSLLFIAGYILYAELLKPKPFGSVSENAREDLEFVRKGGCKSFLKTLGRIVAAPFIGLAYVVALPVVFAFTLARTAFDNILGLAARSISFGWRPLESYLAGRKKRREEKRKDKGKHLFG